MTLICTNFHLGDEIKCYHSSFFYKLHRSLLDSLLEDHIHNAFIILTTSLMLLFFSFLGFLSRRNPWEQSYSWWKNATFKKMYCSQELLSVPQMLNCSLTTHDPSHDLIQSCLSSFVQFLLVLQLIPADLHKPNPTKFYIQFWYPCVQSELNGHAKIIH